MPSPPDPAGLQDADFETIEAAVNETARGRWFLAEYARRTRQAETERLMAAMSRIERAVEDTRQAIPFDVQRFESVAQELAQRLCDVAQCLGLEQRPNDFATDFAPISAVLPLRGREPGHALLEEERLLIEQRLIEPLRDVGRRDAVAPSAQASNPVEGEDAAGPLSVRLESMRRFDEPSVREDDAASAALAHRVGSAEARADVTFAELEAMPLRDRLRFFG